VDWNRDGILDILAGDSKGNVTLFQNQGTIQNPRLSAGVKVSADGKPNKGISPKYEKGPDGKYHFVPQQDLLIGIYSKIHWGDWNGDGLDDLLVGQSGPGGHDLLFYQNTGTAQAPKLAKPEPLRLPEPVMSRPFPYIVDWDGDGKVDLLFGTERAQYSAHRRGRSGRGSRHPRSLRACQGR